MPIRAQIHPSGAITCHYEPNWLVRLFGATPTDHEVEWNGITWVTEHGRMVSYAAHKAIERAMEKRDVEQGYDCRMRWWGGR